MTVQILHGLALLPEKPTKAPKRQTASFSYGARLNHDLARAVERFAAQQGVTVSDLVRTALIRLLELSAPVDGNPLPHIDQPAAQTIAAPRTAASYRGDGSSDHAGLMAVNQRRSQRQANGQVGERLKDKAPVR